MSTMRTIVIVTWCLASLVMPTTGSGQIVGGEITVSASDFDQYLPDVAYNLQRREYMVVWHDTPIGDSRKILGRRYSADGTFIAEYTLVSEAAHDSGQPSIAYDTANDRYLLVYIRDAFGDGSDWDVHGRIIPWDGPSPTHLSFAICNFNTHQWNPRVAHAGTQQNFMVTWWNEGASGVSSYISIKTVSSAGVVSDPSSALAVASGAEERIAPDIAYNQARNEHLITFQLMDAGGGHIYGVRMSAAGAVLGTGEFSIASWPSAETAPRVAASRVADEWAVAWQSDAGASLKDTYARRLWVDGGATVQFADPVHVAGTGLNENAPDIAAYPENTSYLIAWEQQYSDVTGPYGIHARTLDTTNSMGTAFSIRGMYVWETTTCTRPALAGGHTSWFAAWEHDRDDVPSYQDIHGAAISAALFADGFESGDMNAWSAKVP